MSKAHDPHWRYIAFRLQAPQAPSRSAVARAIDAAVARCGEDWPVQPEAAGPTRPQLTRYVYPDGIVRVHHYQVNAMRGVLGSIDAMKLDAGQQQVSIRTRATSGTIKTLTDRLGVLVERRDFSQGGKRVPVVQPKGPRQAPSGPAASRPTKPPRAAKGPAPSAGTGPAPLPGRRRTRP